MIVNGKVLEIISRYKPNVNNEKEIRIPCITTDSANYLASIIMEADDSLSVTVSERKFADKQLMCREVVITEKLPLLYDPTKGVDDLINKIN